MSEPNESELKLTLQARERQTRWLKRVSLLLLAVDGALLVAVLLFGERFNLAP